jgi:ribosome-binding protein aMBF1 (putative translation factor)
MAGRKRRQAAHSHSHNNAGKTCHICGAPANRTSRLVQKDQDSVLVCRPCINKFNLEVVGK